MLSLLERKKKRKKVYLLLVTQLPSVTAEIAQTVYLCHTYSLNNFGKANQIFGEKLPQMPQVLNELKNIHNLNMQATEKDSLDQLSLTHYKKKKMEVAEKKRTEVREN